MKSKYVGLVGVGLVGFALLVVAGELLWASWHRADPLAFGSAYDAYSTERLMVDVEAVRRMDLVEPALPKLVRPESVGDPDRIQTVTGVDYRMFGNRPPAPLPPRPFSRPILRKPGPYPYRVAMTYLSGNHRYAVIDKKLYRKDALLPNGESLAEISDGAVRIDSANGERWIAIEGAGQ